MKSNSVAELDNFYENLSTQITRACLAGNHVFLARDSNVKLGRQFISDDIHDISINGNSLSKRFPGLDILFAQFVRQLTFLRKILDKDREDLVKRIYIKMLKYPSENNWTNNVLELHRKVGTSIFYRGRHLFRKKIVHKL